jgi:C1A family cysteine protease
MDEETVDRPSREHHPAESKHPSTDSYNPNITPNCRGLGWRRQKMDKRDLLFTYQIPEKVAVKLPTKKVLPELPIWDQGQLGSCLQANTLIPLLDGTTRKVKDLAAQRDEFWVYATKLDGTVVPAKATASKTGHNRSLCNVILDNGQTITCTPDHLFMLRDGTYVRADNLEPGMSLMPLRRTYDSGYEKLFDNASGLWVSTHRHIAAFFEELYPGCNTHHVNHDPLDNRPENLVVLSKSAHSSHHTTEMHRENPDWNLGASAKGGKSAWGKARQDPEMYARMASGLDLGRTDTAVRERANQSLRETLARPESREKKSIIAKDNFAKMRIENGPAWQSLVEAGKKVGGAASLRFQIMKLGREILDQGLDITEENWNLVRQSRNKTVKHNRNPSITYTYNRWPKYQTALHAFGSLDMLNEACVSYNCKVVSVTPLTEREDVYCLTVPEYHNFALEAGVFVHNCTGNGVNFVIQYDLVIRRKKPKVKATDVLSRLMTYYGERWLEGSINDDAGAEIRDGIKFTAKYGTCLEDGPDSWPYDILKFKQRPPDSCWEVAKHYQALRYRTVLQNTQALRGCIAEGYPIVFGFTCYSGLDSDEASTTGYVPMPRQNEDPIGGHCVALVGYDDATRRFKFRNSWSEEWGDKGYGYFDYEYVTRPDLSSDFWTVRTVG